MISSDNARQITLALNGKWFGCYGLAFCPAHANTRTPALSLSNGRDGRLLATCHAGCDFPSVMHAVRQLGLFGPAGNWAPRMRDPMVDFSLGQRAKADKRAAQALRLWQEAGPVRDTPAEAYLRGRGIACTLPDTLRYHPLCWHSPSATRLPAMIATVEGSEGFAVHRTYLRSDGSGKAEVSPDKAMLGHTRGGAVRLSEGPKPLAVAEGIETALSLACGLLPVPATIWAALSTSGLKGLHLPTSPGRLIIASDGDAPGRDAAHKLAERADHLGWAVALLPAPEGHDWNDILTSEGKAA